MRMCPQAYAVIRWLRAFALITGRKFFLAWNGAVKEDEEERSYVSEGFNKSELC